MSLEGTTGPGTSPVAFPPAPLMPVPGESERDGSLRSLKEAVTRGEHRDGEVADSGLPADPAEVIAAGHLGEDDDTREALERLRSDPS